MKRQRTRAPVRRVLAWSLVGAAAAALAACSMAGSTLLDAAHPEACSGNLGPYYLSRSLLSVQVKQYVPGGKIADKDENRYKVQVKGVYREADPTRAYCLDYLQAMTSDDLIRVWRNDQGLLQKISSDANDQSAEIIKTIIATIFTAISGAPPPDGDERQATFGEEGDEIVVFEAKFDPTNRERLALINQQLRNYDFCLLTSAQFQLADLQRTSAAQDPETYCEDPVAFIRKHPPPPAPARKALAVSDGIVYRPALPYEVFLLQKVKHGLDSRKTKAVLWYATKRKVVLIENEAPAIAAKIDRTYFAQRTTTLEFDHGTLTKVQVLKDAELVNLVKIPLQIAESVAALPSALVQLRIDQTIGQTKLINSEKELMNAQALLLQQRYAAAPSLPTSPPSK